MHENESKITIIRGLPGSGKSLLARKLAAERNIMHIEPDMLCQAGGAYHYDAESYEHYTAVAQSLLWDVCFHAGADIIYCDVLPTIADVKKVLENVPEYYEIEVIDLEITKAESLRRNRHNVKPEDIERFAADWERWKK
jgi:adenylate kinase family enzyme